MSRFHSHTGFAVIVFLLALHITAGELLLSLALQHSQNNRSSTPVGSTISYDPASLTQIWLDARDPAPSAIIRDNGRKVLYDGIEYDVVAVRQSDEETLYLCIASAPDSDTPGIVVHIAQQDSNSPGVVLKAKVTLDQGTTSSGLPVVHPPYAERYLGSDMHIPDTAASDIPSPPPRLA